MLKLAKLNRDQQIPVLKLRKWGKPKRNQSIPVLKFGKSNRDQPTMLKLRKSGKLNRDRTCYATPEPRAL